MSYGIPVGRVPPEQEVTRVSPVTEVRIPWQQTLKVILAGVLVIALLLLDVLLLGPTGTGLLLVGLLLAFGGKLADAIAWIISRHKFLQYRPRIRRVIMYTGIIALCVFAGVWWFVGARVLRPYWPVPTCTLVDAPVAITCHDDETCFTTGDVERWITCNGAPTMRVSGSLGVLLWTQAQWIRWLLIPMSWVVMVPLLLFALAMVYDIMTKNDFRKPGEHGDPYWWQWLLHPQLRHASVLSWLKRVNVDERELSKAHVAQILVEQGNDNYTVHNITLHDAQWQDLRALAIRSGSFSEDGLSDVGFTSGPHGNARGLSDDLKNAQLVEMQGRVLMATGQFRQWLEGYHWRD